ncbi:WASH complex subunit 3-like [Homarus americanus]|uniref:WASH complex subunit 3-like n=1 Tax=Homarus americanus TaxID=6706 RepID=A0A8J5MNR1_HOMAM|nr:WASH complex subunit 3-like [Homarus americanus]KAG7158256.1 WASH complex subunit 3-like [Homarus americanus]
MERSPVVSPNVDFTKVEAINQKRTLAFINHWALHTVAFLNQFSAVCEERLLILDTKLRRADHTLAILEAKLNSVPGLEGVVAPTPDDTPVATTSTTTNSETTPTPSTTNPEAPPSSTVESSAGNSAVDVEGRDEVDAEASAPAPSATPVSQDSRYAQYFRMLKMGVPDPAVRLKMSSEGVNPSLLDDPDAPAPPPDDSNEAGPDDDDDSRSVSSWSE